MKTIAAGAFLVMVGLSFGAGVQDQKSVPARPINLSARVAFEGAVAVARLKWQDESDNELGFEILRSDNGKEFTVVGFVGSNTDHHRDKVGKYVNGAFAYQVRAFNEHGKSAESNTASAWF